MCTIMFAVDIAKEEQNILRSGNFERINNSLTKLRDELRAMRNQDVQLLKQLIHINDIIHTLYKTCDSSHHISRIQSCQVLPISGYNNRKNVLHQSAIQVPSRFARRKSAPALNLEEEIMKVEFSISDLSISSDESSEESDIEDEKEDIMQSIEDVTKVTPLATSSYEPPLVLCIGKEKDFTDDTYREILNMNVKLWKHVQMSENGANTLRIPLLTSANSNSDLGAISEHKSLDAIRSDEDYETCYYLLKSRSISSSEFLRSSNMQGDDGGRIKGSKSSSNLEIIRECEDQFHGMRHFQTLSDLHSELKSVEK